MTTSPLLRRGATELVIDRLFPEPDPYRDDPVEWMEHALGEEPWSKQREILQSVRDNRYTAVWSCHDSGKSFVASRVVAHHLDTHPVGDAFVVTTAPTDAQVKAILWREIRRAHRKGDLPGRITLEAQWYMGADELVAYGRKPADYDPAAFQGIHDEFVLVVIDEADGVAKPLWAAIDALLTNEKARCLAIGNPDDPSSEFAEIRKPGSGWNQITISAFDTPNFTGEPVSEKVSNLLLSKTWVKEREKRWGKESPLYKSKVLGEYPEISDFNLFPPRLLNAACENEIIVDRTDPNDRGSLGGDVARYGSDSTCVYHSWQGKVREVSSWSKTDTMTTTGKFKQIIQEKDRFDSLAVMAIDVVGLGAGVYDRAAEQGLPVVPFHGGEQANDPKRFGNRRAEVYWTFMEDMVDGLIDLDPEDDLLLSQLGSMRWKTSSSGRIFIESKEEMKKRGLPSPDNADAAVQTQAVGSYTFSDQLEEEHTSGETVTGDLLERPM